MIYHYLVAADTIPPQYKYAVGNFWRFYGWSHDILTVWIYAYTMYSFEGDDYEIISVDALNDKEFIDHLFTTNILIHSCSVSSIAKLRLVLFENPSFGYQVMTKENWEEVDIDGEIVADVTMDTLIGSLLVAIETLQRFAPLLKDEIQLIMNCINRIRRYVPSSYTSRERIIELYDAVGLMDFIYGTEGGGIIRINDILEESFQEHCKYKRAERITYG